MNEMPESVWNDPDFLQRLEEIAEEDEQQNSYENGIEKG